MRWFLICGALAASLAASCGDDSADPTPADDAGVEADAEPFEPRALDDPAVTGYCDCMFLSCHDIYHATWGDDELVARNGCLDEATTLPDGEPEVGPSLTCRQRACDATRCSEAAGLSVCVE